ncbi:MAG: hypothetical protein ACPGWR_08300 [Ardenticatenaceae bacterium]
MREFDRFISGFNRLQATRIVSTPAALDTIQAPNDRLVLRTAADELLIIPPAPAQDVALADPYAIVVEDASYSAIWLDAQHAQRFLSHACQWELPSQRPAFAQGAVAGIATKLYFEQKRVLLIVPTPYAAEMNDRMAHGGLL